MYPNLYYAFQDLFGIELPFLKMVQSFGFFVAMAFLSAGYFFSKELERKENEGLLKASKKKILKGEKATTTELIINAVIGFLVGYKLVYIGFHFTEFLENTQGFILSVKGSFLGGFICAPLFAYFKYKEKEKEKLDEPKWIEETVHPHQLVGNMVLIAAVSGIIGAKIFHNLENLDEFFADPIGSLLSFSGLTMYGGLICGSYAVLYYANKNGLNIRHVVDASAPSIMLGYGVGRIGCQVAGDGDWGINNLAPKPDWMHFLPDWMWSYNYPHNVNGVGIPIPGCHGNHYCNMLEVPVFPTPFYEAFISITLFLVLWSVRKKFTTPGVFFSVYLILNGVERFFIEKIRINTVYHIFERNITQAEIISTLLFFLGIAGIWYFRKNNSKKLSHSL